MTDPITKLIEFHSAHEEVLRGILVSGDVCKSAVLLCGGFERSATTEQKFKTLADELAKRGIASLRFDHAGCGLSDGDFTHTTIQRMSENIMRARDVLEKETGTHDFSVVGHSVAGCAIARNHADFQKIVLLAPALNQKDLLRFWFTISTMKKQDPTVEVTWQNFKEYLNEAQFASDCARTDKMMKAHYIVADYFLENKEKEYTSLFQDDDTVLHIHGDADDKVPMESISTAFKNGIIVKGGDHDCERPTMMKQWLGDAISFIVG
ncbi:MAG: lysophospholipase [Candidatus Azambacteria bacterium]|nr:lysophospholipase [Candidatus Azambacteria bacterium]